LAQIEEHRAGSVGFVHCEFIGEFVAQVIFWQQDVARAAVRRAERRVAELKNDGDLADDTVLMYLNRLSDAVYAMARFADEPEPELFEGRG